MTISRFKTLATPPVPTRVEIAGPAGPGRDNAEAFIRERFAEAWGADVQHFLPLLMSLRESRGRLLGALALRFAAVGGAPVTPRLLGRAAALVLPVFEGYGLSECASVVCLNTPDANRLGSVGHPLPHVRRPSPATARSRWTVKAVRATSARRPRRRRALAGPPAIWGGWTRMGSST